MLTPEQENARTLMKLMGLSEDEAVQKLKWRVAISATGSAGERLALLIKQVVGLTVEVVAIEDQPDLEFAINGPPAGQAPLQILATIDAQGMVAWSPSNSGRAPAGDMPPDVAMKIAACYAAGYILSEWRGGEHCAALPRPFAVDFAKLGITPALANQAIDMSASVLVGGGGVANGFLWAAEELLLTGRLLIVDPKTVSKGNLNRCLLFTEADLGHNKAEVLARNVRIGNLELVPFVGSFDAVVRARQRVKQAIVTVDSRAARRVIQNGLPLEVLDASTTDVTSVVVHSHAQPTDGACLACIYKHNPAEDERELSIAEGLGISVAEVKQDFIDATLARKLCGIHPGLDEAALINTQLTSLYKQLCGAQSLLTNAGEQALAPFAFVSNLAGALLALELLKFSADREAATQSHYLTLDPWRPPHKLARRVYGRAADCGFCADPANLSVLASVWPEWLGSGDDGPSEAAA